MRPGDGWVLVARPQPAASGLAESLRELGFDVLPLAPLGFVAVTPDCSPILGAAPDGAIVVSPRAVEFAPPGLLGCLPPSAVYAVGAATAAALRAHGIVANHPDDARSEGLLELPALGRCVGKVFWLLCGVGGRELIEQVLQQRGAIVHRIETYRRVVVDPGELAMQLPRGAPPAAVVVTSTDLLAALIPVLNRVYPDVPGVAVKAIVPSARVADAAMRAGFVCVGIADGASSAALTDALLQV